MYKSTYQPLRQFWQRGITAFACEIVGRMLGAVAFLLLALVIVPIVDRVKKVAANDNEFIAELKDSLNPDER